MKVGIHLDVPEADYHKLEYASSSTLGKIIRSPAHLIASREQDDSGRSDAFKLGSAAHSIILEPESWLGTWGKGVEGDRRTKAVKEQWKKLHKKYGENQVLTAKQYDACVAMRDAIENHSTAKALLWSDGESEVTLIWDDPATGVRCKARIDRLPAKSSWGIVDLKTTKDAGRKAFGKSLWAYGYYRQAAHYLNGLRILGEPRRHFTFCCVEKEKPNGVAVYRIDEGSVDAGEMQVARLLQTYKVCEETGFWPAYPDEIQDISIPPWAFPEIDEE